MSKSGTVVDEWGGRKKSRQNSTSGFRKLTKICTLGVAAGQIFLFVRLAVLSLVSCACYMMTRRLVAHFGNTHTRIQFTLPSPRWRGPATTEMGYRGSVMRRNPGLRRFTPSGP